MQIPKNLMHVWIGPRPAPMEWMQSWKDFHPTWNYSLIDNEYISQREFRNDHLIHEYMKRAEYAGAADLIRYEILYERGGLMPGADSICRAATDELWTKNHAYTVYENEFMRGKLVSPILACNKENEFVKLLIDRLHKKTIYQLDQPWKTTGNYFVAKMIEEVAPDITIFPSHYFIPLHFTGHQYSGDDTVYCDQIFGETTSGYGKLGLKGRLQKIMGRRRARKMRRAL